MQAEYIGRHNPIRPRSGGSGIPTTRSGKRGTRSRASSQAVPTRSPDRPVRLVPKPFI